jgi:hypothetical protein
MKPLQFADVLCQKQVAEIIGRSNAHHAFDMLHLPGKIALDFTYRAFHRLYIFVQSLTALGQTIAIGAPLEKLAPESAFQTCDTPPNSCVILSETPCGGR